MTNWHAMEVDQVLRELNTDPQQGLNNEKVQSRLKKYGYNELKKEEKISPSTSFSHKLKNILILMLFIAAVVSVLVPLISGISIPAYWISWFRTIG